MVKRAICHIKYGEERCVVGMSVANEPESSCLKHKKRKRPLSSKESLRKGSQPFVGYGIGHKVPE